MTTGANRRESKAIISHITNHRDKSLGIIDGGEFRHWFDSERQCPWEKDAAWVNVEDCHRSLP
jgi:hypothetical protein